jgi:digeranylgeranylglycerophospholipid reductase
MMKDVAIIGGSAAGFFTAYLLARKGVNVRVFEAEDPFNPSPRTLIVTSYMPKLIGSLCESAVVNTIRRFELFADGRVATISLQRPDLVIERLKLIQGLAERVEASGAQVLGGHHFLRLKPNGKRLAFTVAYNGNGESREESTDILVGADGAFSKVARYVGWPKPSTVPLVQAIVELPKDMPLHTTRIWFVPEETPYFYWLIPHASRQGVLGLIGKEGQDVRGALECFLQKKDLEPIAFQNAQVSKYTQWIPFHRKIQESHVYLVGDAAGHVKVTTAGGIVTGFRGAQGVADAILNGGSSRELRALRKELGRHMLMRRILHGFTQKEYARLLDILNPATKRLLGVFTRDETDKLLWNLFLRKPRLLLLGLRSLLR